MNLTSSEHAAWQPHAGFFEPGGTLDEDACQKYLHAHLQRDFYANHLGNGNVELLFALMKKVPHLDETRDTFARLYEKMRKELPQFQSLMRECAQENPHMLKSWMQQTAQCSNMTSQILLIRDVKEWLPNENVTDYTSPELLGADVDEISKSPFTLVFERAGLAFAAAVMNAVILTSILSAGNSGMYASTRMLYAMGNSGMAYSRFGRTDRRGVPIWALLATAIVALAIFLLQMVSDGAYEYIVAASGLTGFIAWLGIAISHYRFRRAYLAQGKSLQDLVYRAKWFPFGPLLALALCILVIIGQDTQWLLHGQFDWQRMVITYMGLPVFVGFYVYHKRRHRTRKIPLDQVNLSQDVD